MSIINFGIKIGLCVFRINSVLVDATTGGQRLIWPLLREPRRYHTEPLREWIDVGLGIINASGTITWARCRQIVCQ